RHGVDQPKLLSQRHCPWRAVTCQGQSIMDLDPGPIPPPDRRAEGCDPAPENRTLSRVDLPADGCVAAGLAAAAGVSGERQRARRPARSPAGATVVRPTDPGPGIAGETSRATAPPPETPASVGRLNGMLRLADRERRATNRGQRV